MGRAVVSVRSVLEVSLKKLKIGALTSHPIQYQAPIFRSLAQQVDLHVYFAHRATPRDQSNEGFGVAFEWDVDLTNGYQHQFLENISRHPSVSRFGGCDTPGIEDIIQKSAFDGFLVMGWHLKAYWQAVRACRRTNTVIVERGDSHLDTPRRAWIKVLKRPVYHHMLRAFDAHLYVGQRNRAYLRYYGVPAERLFFSPHAVDNDWFSGQAARLRQTRSELRRCRGIRDEAQVVLFVGKLQNIKRPRDVVSGVARLVGKGLPLEVVLVGTGELQDGLRAEAARASFPVHFEGFVNQSAMPAMYVLADVVVLPSESETWGLVINEALSCGVPVVVSDRVGCAPDLVEPGRTGFVYPTGDIVALAETLEAALLLGRRNGAKEAMRDKVGRYSPDKAGEGIIRAITETPGT